MLEPKLVLSKFWNELNSAGASHVQPFMTSWFQISFCTGEGPSLGMTAGFQEFTKVILEL